MDRVEWSDARASAEDGSPAAPDVRLIAFYLPQFYPIPENDRWWGPGFTDWRNVAKATPLFDGHYQPRLPGALGFYDLRLDEVRRQQARLARAHGIYGFCYYYYWFNGRRILEVPLDRYVGDPEVDFPFCICWANENWSRRWDGGDHELLLVQEHDTASDMNFIREVIPLFKDPRYIRVNGMPLLVLYRADLLKVPAATVAGWREECEKAGLPGIHLCAAQTFEVDDPRPYGFDSACEFPPHKHAIGHITREQKGLPEGFDGWVCDYEVVARHSLTAPVPDYPLYRGLFPGWDNTARKRSQPLIFHNADPARYEYWLRGLVSYTRQNLVGDERIIFINAWNEWAEGAHLEPDLKHGSAYLEATLRALDGRTDPEYLFRLLDGEIAQIGDPALRGRIEGYATEIEVQLRHMRRTVEYFTRERQMVEREGREREMAAFHRRTLAELFGGEPGDDIECWFERIDGHAPQPDAAVDIRPTTHLEGWMLNPGVFPEAEATARYVLLRHVGDDAVYAARVEEHLQRDDVVAARPDIDPSYSARCGFRALFSLTALPPGLYQLGGGVRSETRSAYAFSDHQLRLPDPDLGGDAPTEREDAQPGDP